MVWCNPQIKTIEFSHEKCLLDHHIVFYKTQRLCPNPVLKRYKMVWETKFPGLTRPQSDLRLQAVSDIPPLYVLQMELDK